MKRSTIALGVATVTSAAVVCLGFAVSATFGHPSASLTMKPANDEYIIDPTVGETFTAATSSERSNTGVISPAEAYRRYSGRPVNIPSSTTVQLGYLTLPLGAGDPDGYTAKDQLVYAYTSTSCGPQIMPPPAPGNDAPASQTSVSSCVEWLFLDASTGDMVDLTWSQ